MNNSVFLQNSSHSNYPDKSCKPTTINQGLPTDFYLQKILGEEPEKVVPKTLDIKQFVIFLDKFGRDFKLLFPLIKSFALNNQELFFKNVALLKFLAPSQKKELIVFCQKLNVDDALDAYVQLELNAFALLQSFANQTSNIHKYISKFNLKEEQIVTLAKHAAEFNGATFAKTFHDYAISSLDALLEIFLIAAKTYKFSKFASCLSLFDEKTRAKIAMVAAQNDEAFARYFSCYDIQNKDLVYDLAKAAAKFKGDKFFEYFEHFCIKDINQRFTLVQLAIESIPWQVMYYIKKAKKLSLQQTLDLIIYAVKLDPNTLNAIDKNLLVKLNTLELEEPYLQFKVDLTKIFITNIEAVQVDSFALIDNVFSYLRQIFNPSISYNIFEKAHHFIKDIFPDIKDILETIEKTESKYIRDNQLFWIWSLCLLAQEKGILLSEVGLPILNAILQHFDDGIRKEVGILFLEKFINNDQAIKSFQSLYNAKHTHAVLICLILSIIQCPQSIKEAFLQRLVFTKRAKFGEEIRTIVTFLLSMQKKQLNPQIIEAIFLTILNQKTRNLAIKKMTTITLLLKANFDLESYPINKLDTALVQLSKSVSKGIDLTKTTLHLPHVLAYYNALNELPFNKRQICLEAFHVFLQEVVNGTFITNRYNEEKNIHLSTIFLNHPKLKEKWMEGSKVKANDFIIEDSDDPSDLLASGLVENSCLNIYKSASKNRGLLGYILDGKYRMVAVKDSNGIILGRRIIKLLWDSKNKKAVLYFSHYYGKASFKEIITKACFAKAKNVDLDFAYSDSPYPEPLYSLDSRAPYEYVDELVSLASKKFHFYPKV